MTSAEMYEEARNITIGGSQNTTLIYVKIKEWHNAITRALEKGDPFHTGVVIGQVLADMDRDY